MKRKLLMALGVSFFLVLLTNGQTPLLNSLLAKIPKAGITSETFTSPSEWRQDSTWDWHWNTVSNDWQRDMRIIRTYNGSGMMLSLLNIHWDYLLSEWVYYEKYSNEYYPDKTTPKYKFRMIWDQSDLAWVEVFHSFYNSEGKVTETEYKSYDATTNSYTGGSQSTYTYLPASTQEVLKILDPLTMSWNNFSRTTAVYDEQENAISSLQEVWVEGLASWVNLERYEFTYNQQGQIQEMIMLLWDQGIFDWKNNALITYEYNSSGWLVSNYMYEWDDIILSWKYSLKIFYHYDEHGYKTQAESYEWDDILQVWENSQKEIYTNYSNGALHKTFGSTWVAALGQFMEIHYTCLDLDGNETESWNKSINYQINEYDNGFRTLSTWTDGLLAEVLNQTLRIPENIWMPYERKTNTWNVERNLVHELWENYDTLGQVFVNSSKTEHFYSSYIGIEEQQGLNGLCYFNNPITPGESIRCTGLKQNELYHFRLISQTGQTVIDKTVWGNGSLQMPENISTGTYILIITGSSGTRVSGKVIVVS